MKIFYSIMTGAILIEIIWSLVNLIESWRMLHQANL